MIRKATPNDLNRIVELGIEALRIERYPNLVLSQERLQAMAVACISSTQHFSWVCEQEGKLMGAVLAMTVPGFWFERSECNVIMFFCKAPGEGVKMLRELLRWYRSRPILKRLMFVCEFDADPRIEKLLSRLGAKKICPVYMF